MKKFFLILSIGVLVAVLIYISRGYSANDLSISSDIKYNESLPKNVIYIDSSTSEHFTYDMLVKLSKKKDETGFLRLWYNLKIIPKNQIIYNNINVTGFLDESMRDIIMPQTFLGFGTDVDDKISIGKDSKGLETARVTYISDSLGLDEITKRLKKEIKVKVIWDSGEEYVIIPSSSINLEILE